jgi:hypothetical protein
MSFEYKFTCRPLAITEIDDENDLVAEAEESLRIL